MRSLAILLLVWLVLGLLVGSVIGAAAQQNDPRSQAIANLRGDLIALETQLRHVEDAFAALDNQAQKDISFLADRVAWWEGCAKDRACWEWLKPPDKVSEQK